ncbi:MAG: zinc-ribbon domain-containing protein [Erysipelotrichaceae bacterium]|nr:zinc-ribbon domain-containing protein [Erysipelotrichaceae bacterium]
MSKFCPDCGRKLLDGALFCDYCGKKMPALKRDLNVEKKGLTKTKTMEEAAAIAIERNGQGEWSFKDLPDPFGVNARNVAKFALKQDKYPENKNHEFYVSISGAIGQYIYEKGNKVFEWDFYTHEEGPEVLPVMPEEIQ